MRSLNSYLSLVVFLASSFDLIAQPAIGEWRDDFQYQHTITLLEGGEDMYCATSSAVFKYNEQDGETTRYTKINALNDVNILSLGWNPDRKALLVGYGNGNLDVITNGVSTNLSDIKRSSVVGDKGIYGITNHGQFAYLACGFGIVVIDLEKSEVKDTWFIGPSAGQLRVNAITFHDDSIYAATQAGLFAAWQGETNLAAYTNWHQRMDLPSPSGKFSSVVAFNGGLVVNLRVLETGSAEKDTIYYQDNGWQKLPEGVSNYNRRLNVSSDGLFLVVTQRYAVQQFDTSMIVNYYAGTVGGQPMNPLESIHRRQGGLWVATDGHGLVNYGNNETFTSIAPNGPSNNSVYRMSFSKGVVYATTGSVSGNWGNEYRKDGVHRLADGQWSTTDGSNDPLYATGGNAFGGSLNDVLAVCADPEDGSHAFVGSWDDGLVEMRDGHITGFFGPDNSSLQRFQNSTSTGSATQIGGLAYDKSGNLWISNSNCISPISVYTKSGSWYAFTPPGGVLDNNTLLSDIVVGDNGYKWVVRPRSSGLLVFSDNGTLNDTGDDQAKALTTFDGEGKLPSMDVFSIAEDKDRQIWVGTNKGIGVFYAPDQVFGTGNFDAQQILIEQDGNVQILLETEQVNAIAVDGANRKWLGTQSSGVFLVSADGTEQLAHFTQANSPLPSDNIISLAIDETSGEVFIGTDQGIMSYRGTATEGSKTAECATVFPNPVRDTFNGQVAITGLMRDSDVRITDVVGNLVYHTTSLGGQALWPATDMSGNRVATGVYLVLAIDPSGNSKCNTKVAVVH